MGIIIVLEFLEVIELVFINEFKSSALFFVIIVKRMGLDWLVRSHRRVSVGASRGPIWVVTNSNEVDKLDGCCMNCLLVGYEIRNVILLCEL